MKYLELRAGDTRKKGDEVCRTAKKGGYNTLDDQYSDDLDWLPVRLIGSTILPSDTLVSSFRRPV